MKIRSSCLIVGSLSLVLSLVQLSLAQVGGAQAPAATDVTTTGGTTGYLPIFNGASTVVNSAVSQSGATVQVHGDLFLPYTTSGGGQGLISIGIPFLHNYGPGGSGNVFLGGYA